MKRSQIIDLLNRINADSEARRTYKFKTVVLSFPDNRPIINAKSEAIEDAEIEIQCLPLQSPAQ